MMLKNICITAIIAVLLTGCVNLSFEQSLYRDGTSDFTIETSIDVPEEYQNSQDEDGALNSNVSGPLQDYFGERYKEKVTVENMMNGQKIMLQNVDLTMLDFDEALPELPRTEHSLEIEDAFLTRTYTYTASLPQDIETDIELPSDIQDGAKEFINATYTLESFAPITETNGELIEPNRVRVNLVEQGNVTVTFTENKVTGWMKSLFS